MPKTQRRFPTALAYATACVAALACAGAAGATAPATRYTDPLGWSLAYPPAMQLERARSPRPIRLNVFEVTVANFPMPPPIRSGSTPASAWMRIDPPRNARGVFPADGIAFRVMRMEGGHGPNLELPETRLPLRLSNFHRASMYTNTTPRPREQTVVADGRQYLVDAWVGATASAAERATLGGIVASLSFPHPRPGETVGYGFGVLGNARRYPVGSFTRVRVQGQPFYLVHGPGGFYAVGWKWQSVTGGYKSRCDLHFDPSRKQFVCTNMHARWDRVGRVLARPAASTRADPLNIAVAKPAWDGHLLLAPGSARFAGARYAHRLWPAAYPSR